MAGAVSEAYGFLNDLTSKEALACVCASPP